MAYSIRKFNPGWLCGSQQLNCENEETFLFGDRERPLSPRLRVACPYSSELSPFASKEFGGRSSLGDEHLKAFRS